VKNCQFISFVALGILGLLPLTGCGGPGRGVARAVDAYDLVEELEAEIGSYPSAVMVEGLLMPTKPTVYEWNAKYHVPSEHLPVEDVTEPADRAWERWREKHSPKRSSYSYRAGPKFCHVYCSFGNDKTQAFIDVIAIPRDEQTEIRVFVRGVQ
jgi:hypothetical protein